MPVARLTTLLSIALLFLAGCNTIREVDEVQVAGPAGLDRLIFGDYWKVEGTPGDRSELGKLAIASFRVEFVQERLTRPDEYNLSQFTTEYGDTLQLLPDDLYEMMALRFRERGHEVTPLATVKRAQLGSGYPRWASGRSSVTQFDRAIDSTAGKIRRIDTRSAGGLAIVDGDAAAIAAADAALAEELGVDAVIHVSVRVGVWKGRATMEEGSWIRVQGPNGLATLRSFRTLASHSSVLRNKQFAANLAGQYNVDARRYEDAMQSVFPAYMGLAAQSIQR